MKFDLDNEGLETVLLPWQVELMRFIWSLNGEVDSRTAHNHLRISPHPMSRATTINFLNKMADEGYIAYRETTTKGGWKRLYWPSEIAPDEEAFRRIMAERIVDKSRRELLEDEKQ